MKITTSRTVAFLTPVFGALAALLSTELAKLGIPGVTPAELTVVEGVAFTSGTAAALKWLHGWAAFERAEQDAVNAEKSADKWLANQAALKPVVEDVESTVEADVSKEATAAVADVAKAV